MTGTWSRTPPTKPGWYWMLMQDGESREPIEIEEGKAIVSVSNGWQMLIPTDALDCVGWYSKRIVLPAPPEAP